MLTRQARLKARVRELQQSLRHYRMLSAVQGDGTAAAPLPPADAQGARREVFTALCASGLCGPGGIGLDDVRLLGTTVAVAHLAITPAASASTSLDEVQGALEKQLLGATAGSAEHRRAQLGLLPGGVEVWLRLWPHQRLGVEQGSQRVPLDRSQAASEVPVQQPTLLPAPRPLQSPQFHPKMRLMGGVEVAKQQLLAGIDRQRRSSKRTHAAPQPGGVDISDTQGISENSAEDFRALRSNIVLQTIIVLSCFVSFTLLRKSFPLVYQGEQLGESPSLKDWSRYLPEYRGWLFPTLQLNAEAVMDEAGIDRGMFILFLDFSIQVMWSVGIPLIAILCPLHYFYGGMAAGQDKLGQIDMANVSHGSWLCWVHAAAVWYVVITVERIIFSQKSFFSKHRAQWISEMRAPRCSTVLVENIREDMNNTEGLVTFFERILGQGVVERAFVVKNTIELKKAKQRLANVDARLAAAKNGLGGNQATLNERKIDEEQEVSLLESQIDGDDQCNLAAAFVTFFRRRDAGVVLRLFGNTQADEEIQVTLPPDPLDIIWEDHMILDRDLIPVRETIGHGCGIMLFVVFVPISLFISAIARWESLHATFGDLGFGFDPFNYAQEQYPEIVALWNGLVGTVVLTLLMGYVPAALMGIFRLFFVLKAKTAQQLKLQEWYFNFLVVFVLLVTAIGSSDFGLLQTVTFLVRNPLEIFPRLAEKMPSSTHFYLEYLVVQCSVQALNITRYWVLIKYWGYKLVPFNTDEVARGLSEPEDQDYYGIGSLSARSTLNLTIALVFCTLTPIICLVALISFVIARLVHSYLSVYAEIKKPDVGGEFFYKQLVHTQQGLFLYIVLMTGVLTKLAGSFWPGAISAAAFLYMLQQYSKFMREFSFREMGLHELAVYEADDTASPLGSPVSTAGDLEQPEHRPCYKQPELPEPKPFEAPKAQPESQWSWLAQAFSTAGRGGDPLQSAPARMAPGKGNGQDDPIFAATFTPPLLSQQQQQQQQQQRTEKMCC